MREIAVTTIKYYKTLVNKKKILRHSHNTNSQSQEVIKIQLHFLIGKLFNG